MSITFYPNYIHSVGFNKTAEPSIITQNGTSSGGEALAATESPMYDLVDNRRTNLFTVDTNGESTAFGVDLDLTADITDCDFCIVDNHNMKTASAEVKPRYAAGTDLTLATYKSGPLGSELTTESLVSGYVSEPTDGILLMTFTAQTDNNFDLTFLDQGLANYTADVTMGEVALGVMFSPTVSPDVPQPESIGYGNSVTQSRGGQKNAVQFHGKRRRWTLGWKIVDETNMDSLKTVWDTCEGSLYPFWIDLGEGSSNPLLYYVRFAGEFNYRKLTHQAYSLTLTIEEEL